MKPRHSYQFSLADMLFCSISALVILAAQALLTTLFGKPLPTGIFLLAIYAAGVFLFLYLRRRPSEALGRDDSLSKVASVLSDAVIQMDIPVVICPANADRIIWHNKAANYLFADTKQENHFGQLFFHLPQTNEDGGERRLTCKNRIFGPSSVTAEGKDGKLYRITILHDITSQAAAEATMRGKECAVGYVMVDNLDELLNYEQEDYRNASGKTEQLLRSWAGSAGGVLKEYQQDRYIFLFEKSHLQSFMDSGFSILDDIRDIRIGESSISVTVSMGICAVGGTLAEKEKNAQIALDTALQRGGDQAVVRGDGTLDIYGGRTKLPQKRTKVRARVIANELISRISISSNVLIMAHKYADFDAFGASVGIARIALFCGVPVNIVTDPDDTNLDRCREWLADEEEYSSMFVSPQEALDFVRSDTLLIITDVNNPAQFESPVLAEHCKNIVIIDHHRKTIDFDRPLLITYIEPSAAAASELVAEMLEQILPGEMLLAHEADLLLAGILLDTNHFTKNTGTRTFSAALYLRSRGADVSEVQEFFKTELDEFQRELKFHSNVEIYRGIAAIACATTECTVKDKVPAAKAADRLLTVEGVKASFAIVPIGDEIHISARSLGTINVQLILEELKGGGHFDSAGARMEGISVAETVQLLKEALDRYLKSADKEKEPLKAIQANRTSI